MLLSKKCIVNIFRISQKNRKLIVYKGANIHPASQKSKGKIKQKGA